MSRPEGNYMPAGGRDLVINGRGFEQSTAELLREVGTLIQVASSGLNLLSRDPRVTETPAVLNIVASARIASERASTLVRETMGRGNNNHHEGPFADVASCLCEIETLIRNAWEPEVQLDVRLGAGLPAVKGDGLGLQNAVLNLIFNARDAMPDGGLISIEAVASGKRGSALVELRVRDSGIGMTPQTAIRACEPFFTTKSKGLGGIGLPTVKRFAEEYGGSVDIQSRLGSGTTVTLRLPAAL